MRPGVTSYRGGTLAAMSPSAVSDLGRRAKTASATLAAASTAAKNAALLAAADLMVERTAELLAANAADVEAAAAGGMEAGPLDRLRLTEARIESMAQGLRDVAALPDPIGEVLDGWRRPNGLQIERMRVPLGVVAIIYENRPNVTSDAAGICLKSGNAALLRGSATALRSNVAVAEVLRDGIAKAGLPADCVQLVDDVRHEAAVELMQLTDVVDCLIPRGGPALIQSIRDNATVPVIIDGDGNCHVYVDASADLSRALDIVVNAKTQRPSVCNAAESLVVHEAVADTFLPRVCDALVEQGVELVGDAGARARIATMGEATDDDFAREFLDLKMSVAVVPSLDDAIAHVNRFSSGHTEAILTNDLSAARRFTTEVDSGTVVVNASTRFTDGSEFGFGAEIGISTQKLHARGPMALRELTTYKYVVWGDGQIRN
ncbi:MAG: glutamate-5-semialdehyde dehydrogenase [Acidimicrobiia bacterium]